jgi:hypothetical protein
MATYPDLYISRDSTLAPDAGIRVDVADDGTILFRRDSAITNFALVIVHELLTQNDFDSLLEFIDDEGFGPHTLTLKGIPLVITLMNEPEIVSHRGNRYIVHQKALASRA